LKRDEYCTFSPQEVKLSADDDYVRKEDLLKLLRQIENFSDVRMIRLKVLKKFDPDYVHAKKSSFSESDEIGVTKGGFTGLVPEAEVKNGIDYLLKAKQLLTKQAQKKEIDKKLIASKASIRPMAKKKSLVDKQSKTEVGSSKAGGKMASKVMDLTVAETGFGKNLIANKALKKARKGETLFKQVKKRKVGRPKKSVSLKSESAQTSQRIHMVSPDGSESGGTDQDGRIACRTDTGNVSQDDSLCDSDHVDSSIKSLLICHDGFPHTFCSKLCCTDVATLDLSEPMEVMKEEDVKTRSDESDRLEANQSLPEWENESCAIPIYYDNDEILFTLKDLQAAKLLASLANYTPNTNGPTSGPIFPVFKEPPKIACPHISEYPPSQERKGENVENQMVPHYLDPDPPHSTPISDRWAPMNNQVWQRPYLSSGIPLTSRNQLETGDNMRLLQNYQMNVQSKRLWHVPNKQLSMLQKRAEAIEAMYMYCKQC
jgi:hypothetical protein